MGSNSRESLYQYSEKVWLTKPLTLSERKNQGINVCLQLDDGSFAAISYLTLDTTEVYHAGDTRLGTIDESSFRSYIEKITGTGSQQFTSKDENDLRLFDKVCQSYRDTASIKKSAKALGVSEEKTRKILITKGLYTCEQYEKISKLIGEGKGIVEIAELLKMSQKQVRAYLPYA